MRYLIILIFGLTGLTSCNSDDFYSVTKTIEAPEKIEINKPFRFTVKLINNTNEPLPLTLDKDITKSIHFKPLWHCGEDLLIDKTPNPKNQKHNYYSVNLKPAEFLSFELIGQLKSYSNGDSLLLMIENNEKDFRLAKPKCKDFYMDFIGIWLPGNGPFADAMEGYNFRSKINIKN